MATNFNLTDVLMGLIISVSIGLSGFSLKWQFDANADIQVMKEEIKKLTEGQTNRDVDNVQDKQLVRFWKLHSWERERLQELQIKTGVTLSTWPDLGN